MTKIEFTHEASEHVPAFTESVEARIWGEAGIEQQMFYIGSGANFQGNANLWLEIIYSIEGAQIFYTRNFLHHYTYGYPGILEPYELLDELVEKGEGRFSVGDILPESRLLLSAEKSTYKDGTGEEQQSSTVTLEISADTGAVFGHGPPGMRAVDIKLTGIELEEGVRFMRELSDEIKVAKEGKHPDPAKIIEGMSEWPLVWQLNQAAYNKISAGYQEDYFANPLLTEAFDGWLGKLPPCGQILDAGCGHGQPVIARLLEKGFQVTGSDFSEEMLRKARQQFPRARFVQKMTTMIRDEAAFDGICSFSSVLYLDIIDFLNSIYRMHQALKRDGLLFLYAYDAGPDWRGEPFSHRLDQWMWSWHYGMEEAAGLLEEHGYFKVLETKKVQVDPGDAKRIAKELRKQKKREKEYNKRLESSPSESHIPFFTTPIERSPYAYVVIAQKCER